MTLMYRIVRRILIIFLRTFWRWRFMDLHKIPADGPVLIAANHISYFDPLCHALCVDTAGRIQRIFAKAELFKNPVLRRILLGCRMIPINRGSKETGPVQVAIEALREGSVIVVYPEATTSKNPDLMPMPGKTGIARIALEAQVPVVPVAVWGSQWVIPPGAKMLSRKSFRKLITMKIGDPIRLDELYGRQEDPEARRDATDRVMKELERLVTDLHGIHPRGAEVPPVRQ